MVANGSSPKSNRFTFALPKSRIADLTKFFRQGIIWSRIFLCLIAMLLIWLGTGLSNPPFPYRTRYVPQRDIVARVPFQFENEALTGEKQAIAISKMRCIYSNDPSKIDILVDGVVERLFNVLGASEYDASLWAEFFTDSAAGGEIEPVFRTFQAELKSDPGLDKLRLAVNSAVQPVRERGVLLTLQHDVFQGNSSTISVYPINDPEAMQVVDVSDVRYTELLQPLRDSLKQELKKQSVFENVDLLSTRIAQWIFARLSETLKLDGKRTNLKREQIRSSVPIEYKRYEAGDPLAYDIDRAERRTGIVTGVPLTRDDIKILRAEHEAFRDRLTRTERIIYSLADFGLYAAVFLMCGAYMYHRERGMLRELGKFTLVLFTFTLTIVLTWIIDNSWRSELVPIAVFSMIISIAYRHEVAWTLGASASLVATYSLGMELTDFVIFVSAVTTGSILCNEISSRTRLVYAGLIMAVITFATTLGAGVLGGSAPSVSVILNNQLILAAWYAFCAFLSGLLITVLMPFVEKLFDVQTDLTLLEWSDPSHPLLHKLIQRAPGTYNHSINVASIAETAADRIGANGLLCRVAAYYHDIGKMLKPEYFVENQSPGENKHDSLVPAMSALVIIAHVKDGVELARKHRLPKCMIDMIEQHHGTTLVEYFYRMAVKEAEQNGNGDGVDEANFRYPGPKPQTKEGCVLMLADSVESACRSLSEPAPARIETLVKEISAKKLNEDQFSDSSLTLRELHQIEQSLIKSLISVYHSRIKYPEQPSE